MAIKLIKDFITSGDVDYIPPAAVYYFNEEAVPVSHQTLLPGHVYTFRALRPRGSDSVSTLDDYQTGQADGVKPYYDNAPIFISLGKAGPLETGLNLKLMPTPVRKKFIRTYLNRILPVLETLTDENGNLYDIEQRRRMPQIGPLLRVNSGFVWQLSEITGINFEFLVDKYKRDEMRNLSMIDWPDVVKLSNTDYLRDPAIASRTPISYFLTKFT
jgi:hypothetical protein